MSSSSPPAPPPGPPARSTYTKSCAFSSVSGLGFVNTYDSRLLSLRNVPLLPVNDAGWENALQDK